MIWSVFNLSKAIKYAIKNDTKKRTEADKLILQKEYLSGSEL